MLGCLIIAAMTLPKLLTFIFSLATSLCAAAAAVYWYRSSRQEPVHIEGTKASISDYQEMHIMKTQCEVYFMQAALKEAARLNKIAACLSAAAAGFGAVAGICSVF